MKLPKASHPQEADQFIKDFNFVLWHHRETDPKRIAQVFKMCLVEGSSAETWWEDTCPTAIKEDSPAVNKEFLKTFRTAESDEKFLEKLHDHKITDKQAQDETF